MFIAALFTITEKQPKCPLTEEWIKKMWYIYTVEYYSVIRKNEIKPFSATRMDLHSVKLSEVCQREEEILYDIPYMWTLKRNNTNELTYKTETDAQTYRRNLWLGV